MKYYTRIDDFEREFTFERHGGELIAHRGDRALRIDASAIGDGAAFSLLVDGESHDLILEHVEGGIVVQICGERIRVEVQDERERAAGAVAGARPGGVQELVAAMPGIVAEVAVAVGDAVEAGQTIVVLEAMKMQNPLVAEHAGVVESLRVAKGDTVAGGALLARIAPPAD